MNSTFPPNFLSGKSGLRVIGDVHGDPAFQDAVDDARAKNLAILSLGDIVDRGPDSPAAIRTLIDLIDTGDGILTPGNHDWSYTRHLMGRQVKISNGRQECLDQMAEAADREYLEGRFQEIVLASKLWHYCGRYLFAHGGGSQYMLTREPLTFGDDLTGQRRLKSLRERAIYGQTDGTTVDGFPKRIYEWADRLPESTIAVIGHDAMPTVTYRAAQNGNLLVFVDTGAGKGGRLSWIDLTLEDLNAAHV